MTNLFLAFYLFIAQAFCGSWFFIKSGSIAFTDSYWLALDGTGDFAKAADHDSLDFERTEARTFLVWIRPTAVDGFRVFFDKHTGGGAGYFFELGGGAAQKLHWQLRNSGTNRIVINGSSALSANTKYLVGVTYDGSSTAAGTVLYVNGVAETPSVTADTLSASTLSASPFYIGVFSDEASEFFAGKIGDLAVFDIALSAGEMSEAYNSGTPMDLRTHSQAANLITPYYWMGDPSGSGTISSMIGSANSLTLNGDAAIAAAP